MRRDLWSQLKYSTAIVSVPLIQCPAKDSTLNACSHCRTFVLSSKERKTASFTSTRVRSYEGNLSLSRRWTLCWKRSASSSSVSSGSGRELPPKMPLRMSNFYPGSDSSMFCVSTQVFSILRKNSVRLRIREGYAQFPNSTIVQPY